MLEHFWLLFLANMRFDKQVVCQMSVGRGLYDDYHDYPDSDDDAPMHFHTYTCRRCGKEFGI